MKRVLLQEVEEEIRDDFLWSMECTHELIQEMTLSDMNMGAALGECSRKPSRRSWLSHQIMKRP